MTAAFWTWKTRLLVIVSESLQLNYDSTVLFSILAEYTVYNLYGTTVKPRVVGRGTSKRGRPRGSRRMSALGRFNTTSSTITNVSSGGSPSATHGSFIGKYCYA